MTSIGDHIWRVDSGAPGPCLGISFSAHGNELAPIDAGEELCRRFEAGELELKRGRLLLIHANPKASAQGARWSEGGVDLNRCFHADGLAREPELYEERRAREIVAALEREQVEILVDFHCTVEPGRRFLMQHPPVEDAAHRRVTALLSADILLADPTLQFGAVSLDEWMTTRGRVGICYETGWIGDPANTPDAALDDMLNLLAGHEMIDRPPVDHGQKRFIELDEVIRCEREGFQWEPGVGENLQELEAETVLGRYSEERIVSLSRPATLVFPKKRPELVKVGAPLVYLASRKD